MEESAQHEKTGHETFAVILKLCRAMAAESDVHYMIELISWDDIIKVNNWLTGSNHLV
jgi:hypothetical protein